MQKENKRRKIINDPVYGFITIPTPLILKIVDHPFFQRLRRINQLGLASLIYPGATHTRFHHALGAMHLMQLCLSSLRSKGHPISDTECEAALIAVLLHDIGHSPFSHALEGKLVKGVRHEDISLALLKLLNKEFDGKLDLAIEIFENRYSRKFFYQLISSQLDVDRLDYLQRDCFYTGVAEGKIGAARIIQMFNVVDEKIVLEEKGIYSAENFLIARRLMHWQVYMHKTNIGLEQMLSKIIRRVKSLMNSENAIPCNKSVLSLLKESGKDFLKNADSLTHFTLVDDFDLWSCIKIWAESGDKVLSALCKMLIDRRLFSTKISDYSFSEDEISKIQSSLVSNYKIKSADADYFLSYGTVSSTVYDYDEDILIKTKDGSLKKMTEISDLPNIKAFTKPVTKHFISYPKIKNRSLKETPKTTFLK